MKTPKRQFSLIMFFGFATYTMMTTQIVPFLTQLGYSPTQRGLVLSLVSITAIFGQMILGYMSDKMKTMKRLFIYISIMMAISGVLSYWFEVSHFAYYLFILGIGAGISRTALNFIEAWVMEVDGMQEDFGTIRAYGSLGWASFSLVAGFVITQFGYPSLALLIGIFTLVVVVIASQSPDAQKASTTHVDLKEVATLFKNPRFVLLIVIYLLAYIAYNADSITLTDYMIYLGADESLIGTKWFIQAISEIPTMMIAYRLIRRKGGPWVMAVGTFVLMIRLAGSAFVANNTIIIMISVLQMFCYPFILISQKDMVYAEIPDHLKSTGQLVSISLSIGLGGALTPILSGILVEQFGIQNTLYIFAALMVIPLYLLSKMPRNNKAIKEN